MTTVPNKKPTIDRPNRIAIIGEAPGEHEVARGVPFVGPSGFLLDKLLSRAGLIRDAIFVGNVCQHRPANNDFNDFNTLEWNSDLVQTDIKTLIEQIHDYKPNILLCLGNASFHLAKENNIPPPRRGPNYNWPNKVGDWRGSLFFSKTFNCKALSSYHPAACLRNYKWTPILHFDLLRLAHESTTPELVLPVRTLKILTDPSECITQLNLLRSNRKLCALDIEGGVYGMSCISFATSPFDGFVIPFVNAHGGNHFENTEEELNVWQALAGVLADPSVPKVLQNSLYDRFVLQYAYKIPVRGVVDDTMLKHWELYCELEKNLGFQSSIYTKEPYYKHERKSDSNETFLLYCAKDSAVTYEISEVLDKHLSPTALGHYRFNVALLNPILYMELRGIRYDSNKAKERHAEIQSDLLTMQSQLDEIAGYGIDPSIPKEGLLQRVQDVLCYKRDRERPKKDSEETYRNCEAILHSGGELTPSQRAYISGAIGCSLNIGSNKQLTTYLYDRLNLPVQLDPKTHERTTDYEALLKLSKKTGHPCLPIILEIRTLTTRLRMLEISADSDGRVRCGYNIVGTETGRLTCYTSPTGSGYNLQTIPSDNDLKRVGHPLRLGMRDLFVADEGKYVFQCDLSGADGWTVAAHCAALGDRTMLDDYLFGLKPAKIVCLGLRGNTRYLDPSCPRDEIRDACKSVEKESWDYFACKRAQHGCLTGDHEVLTPQGWISISLIANNTPILVYDPKTQNAFFTTPSNWVRKPYSGDLVCLLGTAYSFLGTANHRVPYETNYKMKVDIASSILHKNSGRLPYSAYYVGGSTTLTEKTARLIAAIQADGHERETKVTFHFKKERKIQRLIELLSEDYKYRVYHGADGTTQIEVEKTPPITNIKTAGAWMLNWNNEALRAFVDELQYWDASPVGNGGVMVFSISKQQLEWYQTFAHLVGKGSTYQGTTISGFGSTIHRITINNRQFADIVSLKSRTSILVNDVMVYCPTVTTGYFFYRRQGKIAITGNSNYLMGPLKLADQILVDSEGEMVISKSEVLELQRLYHFRYRGVRLWHERTASLLNKKPVIVSASGHRRYFFGRSTEILGEALAHEPQANTTYATNLAVYKLWSDPDNRSTITKSNYLDKNHAPLRIEPLHQVHDALLGQFAIEDTEWAIGKIKSYFDNTLIIAGIPIKIPFEGSYGRDWSLNNDSKIGNI